MIKHNFARGDTVNVNVYVSYQSQRRIFLYAAVCILLY